MADTEQQAKWRAEFDKLGHSTIFRGHQMFPEPKRQFAFRWLREKEIAREARENAVQWYAKWTFWVAVAAAVFALIGIVVSVLH